MKSPAIAAEVGGVILEVLPQLKVDLSHPDITVRVEVRDRMAYIHAGQERGAGRNPAGVWRQRTAPIVRWDRQPGSQGI